MKKTIAMLISVIFVVTLFTAVVFAEDTASATATPIATTEATATPTATVTPEVTATATPEVTATVTPEVTTTPAPTASSTATTTPAATVSPAPATESGTTVTIAPDNILYSLKRLVESIQVALTFSPEGKAELLVTLADNRLAEAELMSEKNKQELVEQIMKAYVKTVDTANEKLEEAALDGKDVTAVLDDIRVIELTADKLVIKATGVLPAESAEALKAQVTEQVQRTLAVQAFAIAKTDFKDANAAAKDANEELKTAEKSGDEAAIKAAKEKLALALQAKTDAEKLKDEVEAYKNDIIKDIKDEDEKDDKDRPDQQEKLQEKIAHMEKVIAKIKAKREEQIEKHKGQPGKASKKIEENTNKQLDKKNIKVDELKAQLQATATTDQTLTTSTQSTSQASIAIAGSNTSNNTASANKGKEKAEKKRK